MKLSQFKYKLPEDRLAQYPSAFAPGEERPYFHRDECRLMVIHAKSGVIEHRESFRDVINFFDEKDGSCEIGYGVGSGYWNRGYATEAVHRFLEYLFREKGLNTVYASFFTGNDASRRVMEKCGMHYSHFVEKELIYLDIPRDLTYYVIHDSR